MNRCLHRVTVLVLCCAVSLNARADAQDEAEGLDGEYDCLIEPSEQADVGSASRGIVSHLFVRRGEPVRFEQPIVQLESTAERTALQLAEARAAMQSEIASRRVDLELARQDRGRFDDPLARELTTEKLRDEADARERVARAALVQAQESLRLRNIELQGERNELARRTIISPFDGVVVAELVSPGELVFDTPVMRLAVLDPLHVELVLEARLFGSVQPGDIATLVPEIGDGTALEASVTVVDPIIDAGSGTFGVRLQLANPDRKIPAGQRCRVRLVGSPAAARSAGSHDTLR